MGGALKVGKNLKDEKKILKKKPLDSGFGGMQNLGGGNFSSKNEGLVSVVAMTPYQGMQLVNPDQL